MNQITPNNFFSSVQNHAPVQSKGVFDPQLEVSGVGYNIPTQTPNIIMVCLPLPITYNYYYYFKSHFVLLFTISYSFSLCFFITVFTIFTKNTYYHNLQTIINNNYNNQLNPQTISNQSQGEALTCRFQFGHPKSQFHLMLKTTKGLNLYNTEILHKSNLINYLQEF